VSVSFFKRIGGVAWIWNIILTAILFAVPFFVLAAVVDRPPFQFTLIESIILWLIGELSNSSSVVVMSFVVVFPFILLGGILGKNRAGSFDAPCHTNNVARKIPPMAWYQSTATHVVVGGLLQFR